MENGIFYEFNRIVFALTVAANREIQFSLAIPPNSSSESSFWLKAPGYCQSNVRFRYRHLRSSPYRILSSPYEIHLSGDKATTSIDRHIYILTIHSYYSVLATTVQKQI